MLSIYLGAYVVLLAVLWGFFLVARHHSFKFQNFSTNIVPVTNVLFIFLLILSIIGFLLIFALSGDESTSSVDRTQSITETYY